MQDAFENRAFSINRALPAPPSGAPIDAAQLAKLVWEISDAATHEAIREAIYAQTLFQLQCELFKLQRWVHAKKLKVVVIFEGRDAAGKGGMIKRVTHRLDPRVAASWLWARPMNASGRNGTFKDMSRSFRQAGRSRSST